MHLASYGQVMAFEGTEHYYLHHITYAHSPPISETQTNAYNSKF